MSIEEVRKQLTVNRLDSVTLNADPFSQFEAWLDAAVQSGISEPTAMSLATVDESGQPWQRMVLLKTFDVNGFVFYTNYGSRKAGHININNRVSVLFPWHAIGRQVIITGTAVKVSSAESLKYFLTRPRGSQIGAWVSHQSRVLESRKALESAFALMKDKYVNRDIPLPPHWGGYRITPKTFEFWQSGEDRLHDRFLYTKSHSGKWEFKRLAP